MLNDAKELFELGWAVHWLQPNSKIPVKEKWQGPVRDDWATLEVEYRRGFGLGVRLGEASRLPCGNYLANVDIDIKSAELHHREEALACVEAHFPGLLEQAPIVVTGYGLRLFLVTKQPLQSRKIKASGETCKVFMPTADVSRQQRLAVESGLLTEAELKAGWRMRPAWEVEFMSIGKQVVLPPTVHPDTKKPYRWNDRALTKANSIPLIEALNIGVNAKAAPPGIKALNFKNNRENNFSPLTVDLSRLSREVQEKIIDGVTADGLPIQDRSAECLSVAMSMVRNGYGDDEILSVLTDTENFLGEVAYEHAKSHLRIKAAVWARRFCLEPAHRKIAEGAERDEKARQAEMAEMADAPIVETKLYKAPTGGGGRRKARKKSGASGGGVGPAPRATTGDWRDQIQYAKNGSLSRSLFNVVLILENAVGPEVFRHNKSNGCDYYGIKAPWPGGTLGKKLRDRDIANIRYWLAKVWSVEVVKELIWDTITVLASRNEYHPVIEELEALAPWDGVKRLGTWLKNHFHARGPDDYLSQVFTKWLVASVMRTYEPGTKFDWMPIFEGAQGTGKSSFGAALFGPQYFRDQLPSLNDKDAAIKLQGLRCVEFNELVGLTRNELNETKAFVTRQLDDVRPPYGRLSVEMERQVVFLGTTNLDEYFRDETGNRRFMPIECGMCDFDTLRRDRDQLWAEALWLYENGIISNFRDLELTGEAESFAAEIQKKKMVADESIFMERPLRRFFMNPPAMLDHEPFDPEKFQIAALFAQGGPLEGTRREMKYVKLAAKTIASLGGEKRGIMGTNWWRMPPLK